MRYIKPDWPAPSRVRSLLTTKLGGESVGAYTSFNLATHVGDDPVLVKNNRSLLNKETGVSDCLWLQQVHSSKVIDGSDWQPGIEADACTTTRRQQACVVLTADCVPVLLCDEAGTQVASAHAGWRGLAANILRLTINHFTAPRSAIMAYIGPCIHQAYFEVGEDVKTAFMSCAEPRFTTQTEHCFQPNGQPGKYQADLVELTRLALTKNGVKNVYGGDYCTGRDHALFYSFRREGKTGRNASAIWLA